MTYHPRGEEPCTHPGYGLPYIAPKSKDEQERDRFLYPERAPVDLSRVPAHPPLLATKLVQACRECGYERTIDTTPGNRLDKSSKVR